MHESGLLVLPAEILNHILSLSREPAFIHVCHRTWQDLPSFIWYSRRLAALAFYSPVYDHLYSDYPIELFERYKLPGFPHPFPEEERSSLVAQILCSHWFTGDHLVATARDLALLAIEEALRMLDIETTSQQKAQVLRSVERFGLLWELDQLNGSPHLIRWDHSEQFWYAEIRDLTVLFHGPRESKSGRTLPPWRMGLQILKAYVLDVPVLPDKLVELVAAHDWRSYELMKLLYNIRTVRDRPRSLFVMSSETSMTVQLCIEHLLRSDIDPTDPDDEHLKLLLLYDGAVDSRSYNDSSRSSPFSPIKCSCPRKTEIEQSSIYIRRRYYEFVTEEGNTEGLHRLVNLNPALCLPSPHFFKTLFSNPKTSQKSHLQDHKRIYTEAWEKAQNAKEQAQRKKAPRPTNARGRVQKKARPTTFIPRWTSQT